MIQPEVRLEDFLCELGFGEVRMRIADGKFIGVPKQKIERPAKWGMRMEVVIDEPIRLRCI